MSTTVAQATYTIALIGNPNTGKSTLFNALCGLRQRVGNYPGVTVEKKVGSFECNGRRLQVVDLPGTYSLAPHSPDEMVAVDVLLGRKAGEQPPDAVLVIVDASNLERNLYLLSQVLEFECPVIVALNMTDVAQARGVEIDVKKLEQRLGLAVIPVQANRKEGLEPLRMAISYAAADGHPPRLRTEEIFPAEFRNEVATIQQELGAHELPRYLAERLLLDSGYLEESLLKITPDHPSAQQLSAARQRLADSGHPVPAVEAMCRYDWVSRMLEGVLTRPQQRPVTWSDRIDRLLTHKVGGSIVFLLLMMLVFRSVFAWAGPAMDLIETATGYLATAVSGSMADGPFKSLLVDGVIGGVGGVIVFLPQIFILFFFIALLEDCGYMARAAYLMDKLMVQVGLSGKSFIPLLSSFACAIPGIMATRVIENRRDRLTTILVAPLMSCSARLPVYTLLIAAFIPERTFAWGVLSLAGLTLFSMYMLGIVTAVIVALLLKKTVLRGETPAFVMELPSYKMPSLRLVLWRMAERGWAFIRRAGTLIFAVSVVVWATAYYPRNEAAIDPALLAQLSNVEEEIATAQQASAAEETLAALEEQRTELENEIDGEHLRHSYLGRAGHRIEPLVRPLGWDWKIGCAAIASFPAREVVVGTLGVLYNLGGDTDEESTALRENLKAATWEGTDQKVFNLPVALSLMVFFALCAQCAATLVVIRRETASWRWPIFTFVYMTTLAYIAALVTYQAGSAWLL